jgi:hypothetical protein
MCQVNAMLINLHLLSLQLICFSQIVVSESYPSQQPSVLIYASTYLLGALFVLIMFAFFLPETKIIVLKKGSKQNADQPEAGSALPEPEVLISDDKTQEPLCVNRFFLENRPRCFNARN